MTQTNATDKKALGQYYITQGHEYIPVQYSYIVLYTRMYNCTSTVHVWYEVVAGVCATFHSDATNTHNTIIPTVLREKKNTAKPRQTVAALLGLEGFSMGNRQSNIVSQNVLLLGLDSAGKTSIVARLIGEEVRTVLPTLGFSIHAFTLGDQDTQLKLWDVGGRAAVRHYWPAYYGKAHAIAFVVDSTDRHRLAENSAVLQHLLDDDDLLGLPLLVVANKQDAEDAIPAAEVRTSHFPARICQRNDRFIHPPALCDQLEVLMNLGSIRDRQWYCTSSSALRGTGIVAGLKWLSSVDQQMRNTKAVSRKQRTAGAALRLRLPGRRSQLRADDESGVVVSRTELSTRSDAQTQAIQGRRRRKPIPTAAPAPTARSDDEDLGSDED